MFEIKSRTIDDFLKITVILKSRHSFSRNFYTSMSHILVKRRNERGLCEDTATSSSISETAHIELRRNESRISGLITAFVFEHTPSNYGKTFLTEMSCFHDKNSN